MTGGLPASCAAAQCLARCASCLALSLLCPVSTELYAAAVVGADAEIFSLLVIFLCFRADQRINGDVQRCPSSQQSSSHLSCLAIFCSELRNYLIANLHERGTDC